MDIVIMHMELKHLYMLKIEIGISKVVIKSLLQVIAKKNIIVYYENILG
jgi:hypothetical protein